LAMWLGSQDWESKQQILRLLGAGCGGVCLAVWLVMRRMGL